MSHEHLLELLRDPPASSTSEKVKKEQSPCSHSPEKQPRDTGLPLHVLLLFTLCVHVVCLCMYICVCACVFIYLCVYVHVCLHLCMSGFHACMYMCYVYPWCPQRPEEGIRSPPGTELQTAVV